MTEAEWMAATDPNPMLEHLWTEPGNRKLRLFGAACCRQVWGRLMHIESRQAVEAVERYADGGIDTDKLADARNLHRSCGAWKIQRNAADTVSQASFYDGSTTSSMLAAIGAAKSAAHAWTDKTEGGARSYRETSWVPLWNEARSVQVAFVRDIFGNPFRPVAADPSWFTSTVLSLAQGIYDDRAFDHLPILADALQDEGCENPDILDHCRGPGPHVRGCFVVDILTGRK